MRWKGKIATELSILILIFACCIIWIEPGSGTGRAAEGIPLPRATGELMLDVDADSFILASGNTTRITVTVNDGEGAVNNVSLDFSSSKGVFDITTTSTNSSGMASVNYTAPVVVKTQDVVLTLTANRTQVDESRTDVTIRVLSSVDDIPPVIESVFPANNSHNVSLDEDIIIGFFEPMNVTSVAAALWTDPDFEYTLIWNENNLSIDPKSSLLSNTNYTVYLSKNATDLFGNPLEKTLIVNFTTGTAPLKEEMILNLTGLPVEMYEGTVVIISARAFNSTGVPLEGVNVTFNVTGPAITAASWGLTDVFGYFNTSFSANNATSNESVYFSIKAIKENFTDYNLNRTIAIMNRISFPEIDVSINYLSHLYSLEHQKIGISVQWNSSTIENAAITLESSAGSLSPESGMTDSLGLFEATYTAPNTSVPVTIDLIITVSKTGYRTNRTTLKVMVSPLVEYEIHDELFLANGSRVDIAAGAEGTVRAVIEESVNPTRFTQRFMDIFIRINVTGQGRLLWVNMSVKYLFVPQGEDEDTIAMYSLRSPEGPWVKCLRTGVFPSSNTVWANITWTNASEPYIFAPRTKDVAAPVKSMLTGRLRDENNRSLPGVMVELYKSDIKIDSRVTDVNGIFLFEDLETGLYRITVDHSGYEPLDPREVQLIVGNNEEGDIILSKVSKETANKDNGGVNKIFYLLFLAVFIVVILIIILKMARMPANTEEDDDLIRRTPERKTPPPRRFSPLHPDRESDFECPVCGNGVPRDSDKCSVCGGEFMADVFVCPDCGMPLSPDDRYCKMCGTIFGNSGQIGWDGPAKHGNERSTYSAIDDFEVVEED